MIAYPDRKHLVLRYLDPITEKQYTRSARTANRREAERAAAKWEAELQEGRYQPRCKLTWQEFRERYEKEKLSSLSWRTTSSTDTAFNHLERIVNPAKLAAIDSASLSRFQAELRREGGHDETSIATHLRHIRAALGWATSMGFIAIVPRIEMRKRAKGKTLMRGRPITTEEFERMLAAVAKVRHTMMRSRGSIICRVFGYTALRLEGAWCFPGMMMRPSRSTWRVDGPGFSAEAGEGHQDRLLPMTPDFAEFLQQTPTADRRAPFSNWWPRPPVWQCRP